MQKIQKTENRVQPILMPVSIKNEQSEKNVYNANVTNAEAIEIGDPIEQTSAKSQSDTDKFATQEDFTRQAMDYRRKFYSFHRILESLAPRVNEFAKEMKQQLTVKIPRLLDHQALGDNFERQLYKLAKNPKQTKKNWSEEETIFLVSVIAYYTYLNNRDFNSLSDDVWNFIAEIYPGKKAEQLRLRWFNIYKIKLDKAPWTPIEDDILYQIIQEKGAQHWKSIALELNTRSGLGIYRQGKQCRERWINHLDPSVKKGGWNEEEDMKLLKYFIELGKKWAEIAKRLGGRTENGVKNRWISLIKRYKSENSLDNLDVQTETDEDNLWEKKVAQAIVESRAVTENVQGFSLLTAKTEAEEKKEDRAEEGNGTANKNATKQKKKQMNAENQSTQPSKKNGGIAPTKIEADSSNKAGAKLTKATSKAKEVITAKNPLTKNLEKEEFYKPKKMLPFSTGQSQPLLPVTALRNDLLDSNQLNLLTSGVMNKNHFIVS